MTIEILYLAGCPNHERLREHLPGLLQVAGVATEPTLREITTQPDAERERFLGSPTLRVNRHDVEPAADNRTDYRGKCRIYRTPEGLTGFPQTDGSSRRSPPDPPHRCRTHATKRDTRRVAERWYVPVGVRRR
jgi:hypothetical protein